MKVNELRLRTGNRDGGGSGSYDNRKSGGYGRGGYGGGRQRGY